MKKKKLKGLLSQIPNQPAATRVTDDSFVSGVSVNGKKVRLKVYPYPSISTIEVDGVTHSYPLETRKGQLVAQKLRTLTNGLF